MLGPRCDGCACSSYAMIYHEQGQGRIRTRKRTRTCSGSRCSLCEVVFSPPLPCALSLRILKRADKLCAELRTRYQK